MESRVPPDDSTPVHDRLARRLLPLVPAAVAASAAAALTYAYAGYRYGVWPQPGLLESVLALKGELKNDWFTALPPVHWVLAHLLSLLPLSVLPGAMMFLWIAGLLILWGSIAALLQLMGAGHLAALGAIAAALIALPTALDGVGESFALQDLLYPTTLAFAVGMAGLACLAAERAATAGIVLGIATVVHPNVGALFVLVIAPATLVLRNRIRAGVRLLVAYSLIAAFPLIHLALDKALSNNLPQRTAYDLFVIVRNPHHALYGVFPTTEYVHTLLWLGVFVLALPLIAAGPARRVTTAVVAATVLLDAAGGIASETRHPFVVVELLTSRVSPLVVLLGIVAGVTALLRVGGSAGVIAAVVAFELARRIAPIGSADVSAVEAGTIAVFLTGCHVLARRAPLRPRRTPGPIGAIGAATALGVGAAVVVLAHGWGTGLSPQDVAWRQAAAEAHAHTVRGAIILTPPDLDGFRFFARRAIVVDYGEFPFGKGTNEWSKRLVAVTGDPAIVTARLPADATARSLQMGQDYDRFTAHSPSAACTYRVALVVTRTSAKPPRWLVPVFRNADFVVSRLAKGTCRSAETPGTTR
jgi:hypothetical protein